MQTIKYFVGAAALLLISSCESINNLFEVKVDTEFEVSIPLETETTPLKNGTPIYSFSGEKSLDPLTNEDLVDIKDRMKEIAINGIDLKLTSDELSEIKISIMDVTFMKDNNTNGIGFQFHDITITEGISEVVSFLQNEDLFKMISDWLAVGPVNVYIAGQANKPGITMNAVSTLASTVYAGL